MDAQDRLQHALELAYGFLGRRDRTVAEVQRHLQAKGVTPPAVGAAIEELQVQGYLDDVRYAQRFVEDRRALDGWGRERIERKLMAVGVAGGVIERALADRDGEGELEAAVAVLRRRFASVPNSDGERERALGMLARKGYELELCYDAVRAFERESA